MTDSARGPNVVADFCEWYQRRQEHGRSPLATYALDKCEETFRRAEWNNFGYWFAIYHRERPHASKFDARKLRRPR